MPDFTVVIADFPAKLVDRDLTRANLGISPETVAYLSVATGHKVNPELVRSHISILKQVPQSILLHKGFCDVEVVRSLYAKNLKHRGLILRDASLCRDSNWKKIIVYITKLLILL